MLYVLIILSGLHTSGGAKPAVAEFDDMVSCDTALDWLREQPDVKAECFAKKRP